VPVKSHCTPYPLAFENVFPYFGNVKTLGRIAYWLAALVLLACLLTSLDYTLSQAILISLLFGPCAIALEFLIPKARKPMDKIYLALAVLVAVVLLIVSLHVLAWSPLRPAGRSPYQPLDVPPMLINPIFLGLILTALAIGDLFWGRWLDRRFADRTCRITFFSDRKSVTLDVASISYIESNDTEVRIVTADGASYRNKTGISQWANLLGEGFLRIHRSYLVNAARATRLSAEEVLVDETTLPVSRKYRELVQGTLRPAEEEEFRKRMPPEA